MESAFTIMQIGDPAMDRVYDEAIDPAIRRAGLSPRRVDRHNEGDLLKSEIVQFIETAQVIVADITNERPNCYLEIGYAMGLGKKKHLILTAREDHHHSSPNFHPAGPKVHFDLEGYSIIFWDPEDLAGFQSRLEPVIARRAAIVRPEPGAISIGTQGDWQKGLRSIAETGLASIDRHAYMEVAAEVGVAESWPQQELLKALTDSSIHTFGWPIAVILENRPECRPRPTSDGIQAEVAIGPEEAANPFGQDRRSYDFWKLFRDGRFYTLLSLFEDERARTRRSSSRFASAASPRPCCFWLASTGSSALQRPTGSRSPSGIRDLRGAGSVLPTGAATSGNAKAMSRPLRRRSPPLSRSLSGT